MPKPNVPDELLQEALNLVEQYGSGHLANRDGGSKIPRNTINGRAAVARLKGMRPTVRKDAPRVYTQKRLGRMHMVIPDTQVRPGVKVDHLEWAGNYAAEKRPDVIVMIGDWFDMPSLCDYERGKLAFEGRRYVNDVKAGKDAMQRFLAPIKAVKEYKPRMVFTMGNHEHRIIRYVDNNPEFSEKFSFDDLGLHDFGWEVHDFLKPVEIDGILYCHYFVSGAMGRPVSSAAALLREFQQSCTMGHNQNYDIAVHKKTLNRTLFAGCFYTHDEKYLTPQGQGHKRHLIIKHEVEDGKYDLMEVSVKFLEKAYS